MLEWLDIAKQAWAVFSDCHVKAKTQGPPFAVTFNRWADGDGRKLMEDFDNLAESLLAKLKLDIGITVFHKKRS